MDKLQEVNLIASFHTALLDCFRDEDNRQLDTFASIDIKSGNCNDMVLCMFRAFKMTVDQITDFDGDPLEFLAMLTRLLFLDNMKEDNVESEVDDEEKEDNSDESSGEN